MSRHICQTLSRAFLILSGFPSSSANFSPFLSSAFLSLSYPRSFSLNASPLLLPAFVILSSLCSSSANYSPSLPSAFPFMTSDLNRALVESNSSDSNGTASVGNDDPPPPAPPPPPPFASPPAANSNNSSFSVGEISSYAIDFSLVPATAPAVTVQVVGLGACACDLTRGGCDSNCCCDRDCDSLEKQLFNGCEDEGPPAPSLHYCVPKTAVAKVNLPKSGGLGVVQTVPPEGGFLQKQLCIVYDNNAMLGLFFHDPPPATAKDVATAVGQSRETFFDHLRATSTSNTTSTFRVNDTIPAAYAIGEGLGPVGRGHLALPAAALSSACEPINTVGFMLDVEEAECQRIIEDLSADCTDVLSSDTHLQLLRIGKGKMVTLTEPAGYVGVTVVALSYIDSDLIATPVPANSSAHPQTTFDATSGICQDALLSVAYTVVHNGRGSITRVEASVEITDVPPGTLSLRQRFKLSFIRDGTQAQVRPKSGNPGYMRGMPILAGSLLTDSVTSKLAVSRFVEGLPLPTAGPHGECGGNFRRGVAFGASQLASCSVPMTLTQLRGFCQRTGEGGAPFSSPPLSVQLLGGLFHKGSNDTYVGMWADADALNINAWIKIEAAPPVDNMAWSEATRTCTGVIAGLRYELLTQQVGASTNPQPKVGYARLAWIRADWTFSLGGIRNETQNFPLQHGAHFLRIPQDGPQGISPRPPPLLPTLPDDVFYPFFISSHATLPHMSLWRALLVLLCALALARLESQF